MSRTTLIEIQPRRPDGTVETLRLVDRSPRAAAYLGAQWLPLVTELPGFEMAIGFDGQRFGAQPSPQIGALAFALAPEIRAAAGWVWRDAPVTIRQADWPIDGSNPADGAFTTVWTGNAASFSSDSGVARVELIDKGQLLRVPVAPLRFGSTGIALLDAAAAARDRQAGQVVPVAFGRVLNLPGLLVDRANNIWLFAAQPAASVQAFYDGGVAFTLGSARANLAALQGTSPAPGTVDWCVNASGALLARPADRPVYPFTCDATFASAALGDVMAAIVGGRLTIWAGEVAALNGLGLGECGLYIDDETTVAEALDRLFAGLGIFWKVRTDGLLRAFRMAWDAPAASFAAHQRHAPRRLQTILPTARRQLGYATNNRVHGEGEIARILLATDLAYADGTPIEALKPAEAGANLTAPANSNVVPYSLMEGDNGWGVLFNPSGLDVDPEYGEFYGLRFFKVSATATASGQQVSIGNEPSNRPHFPLPPGKTVLVMARVEVAGVAAGSYSLELWGFQSDNVTQAPIGSATGTVRFIASDAVAIEVNVPIWAVKGRLELRGFSASAGSFQVAISEPFVTPSLPGQTARPPFTPGPNAADGADVTSTALVDLWRGDWQAGVIYRKGQGVVRNRSGFIANQDHTSTADNGPPGALWNTYAGGGVDGAAGAPGAPGATGPQGVPGVDGVDGVDGTDGKLIEFIWRRAASLPSTPTGNGIPSGWSDNPPAGSEPLWMSKGKQELDGTLIGAWSVPVRHDGPPGATGATGAPGAPGAPGATGPQGPTGVSAPPVKALGTGAGQFDPIRLAPGQTLTVRAQLYLNTGGSAGVCSLEVQISVSGANSWSVMTSGSDSDSQPTSEPVELEVAGATFTNSSGIERLYDVRSVSVRNGRSVNQPQSFMEVI